MFPKLPQSTALLSNETTPAVRSNSI